MGAGQGPDSGVTRHFALFTAVECRVVEEGAAFTVPTRPLKVFVLLRPHSRLGAMLPFCDKHNVVDAYGTL